MLQKFASRRNFEPLTAASLRFGVVVGCIIAGSLTFSGAALAQPATKARPQPGGPAGRPPTGGTTKAAPRPGATRPGAQPAAPNPEAQRPPDTLPPGYQPPGSPPDVMSAWNELLNANDLEAFRRNRSRYSSILRNGAQNDADRKILADGLQARVQILSMRDQLRELHDRRLEFVTQDLANAGRLLKPDEVKRFRQQVLDQVIKFTEPLLKNNFYARIQAVTLLGELDLLTDDVTRNLKHETYPAAAEPLVRVLQDPEQPIAVKIAAARSLVRLMRFGDVRAEFRRDIATAVLSELARNDTHYWYQMRLAEVLSTLDSSLDLNQKPYIVNGLLAVVRDPQRDFRARCEAAKALGRVPLDRQVDISALNRDLMKLTVELAQAMAADPKQAHWKHCFFDLYLAYRPLDKDDREASRKELAGLLKNPQAATASNPTFQLLLPLVNAAINGNPPKVTDVQAVQNWLDTNSPVAGANNTPVSTRSGSAPPSQQTNSPN